MTTNQLITKIGRQRVLTALSNVVCSSSSSGGGTGDVTGPSSATDDHIALFSGATGKIIKDIGISPIALQSVRRNSGNNAWEAFTPQNSLGFNPSRRIIYQSNNISSSLTGTTNETVMDSVLIPAGTFSANDIVYIRVIMTKVGTAGTMTGRLRINTQANGPVIGTSTQMNLSTSLSTSRWHGFERFMYFKNSLSSILIVNSANNWTFDLSSVTDVKTTLTNDFSAAQYIFIACQLSNSTDTLTLESWMIEAIRT